MTVPAETPGPRPARSGRDGWVPWILLVIVMVVTLAVAATGYQEAATNQDRVDAIARTVKCPICAGESVAESNAELSRTIRVDIARRVEAGETDEQIRDAYVAQYGDAVLLAPPSSGVAGLVWVLPVVLLALSLTALGFAFGRWAQAAPRAPTDADRDVVAAALARREAAGAAADRAREDGALDVPDELDSHGEGSGG